MGFDQRSCVLLALCFAVLQVCAVNNRPIIGVLATPLLSGGCETFLDDYVPSAHPTAPKEPTSCFHSLYVKWLEGAGARVVPIRFDEDEDSIRELVSNLNGILFTGGGTPITDIQSQYMKTAGLLLKLAITADDHLPLWGTCMGLQTLSILVAGDPAVLESNAFVGVDPAMLPLYFTAKADSSRLLGKASTPTAIRQTLMSQNVTTNLHHDGVSPQTYTTNSQLSSFFKVLSTNVDVNNRPFVSTIEAISRPIYAVQWHPERPQFDWHHSPDLIDHGDSAVEIGQYLSNFLVREARKNDRHFADSSEEAARLIYNYQPLGTGSYAPYFFSP